MRVADTVDTSGRADRLHHCRRESGDGRQERRSGLAGVLDEELVYDDQAGHGLDNGDRARNDAGVVPTAGSEGTWGAVVLGRLLRLRDGCGRLESDPDIAQFSLFFSQSHVH